MPCGMMRQISSILRAASTGSIDCRFTRPIPTFVGLIRIFAADKAVEICQQPSKNLSVLNKFM